MNNFITGLKEKYYRQQGQKYLVKGNIPKTLSYFQKAILLNDSFENIFNLGLSYMSLNNFQTAEKYFAKIQQKYPDNEMNLLSIAECKMRQKKWKEAGELYGKLVAKNPLNKKYSFYLDRSKDVVEREKYAKSKDLLYLSQEQISEKNFQKALEILIQAAEYDPKNANIQNNIGYVYIVQRKFDKAFSHFEKAVALDPDNKKYQKNFLFSKRKLRK